MTVPGCVGAAIAVGRTDASCAGVSVSLARPKSRILTKPSFETMTFSGFRSRWTMPAAWALASPSAIWTESSRRRLVGSGSPEATSSRSVLPSTSSMAM